MLYSLQGEIFEKATTRPDPYQMIEKEAYDMFLEYMKYKLLVHVINNPDVAPYSTILKVLMISWIKD